MTIEPTDHRPPRRERPSDAQLRTLLMLSHAHLHQFVPLHHKAHETREVQKRLQEAWEGL